MNDIEKKKILLFIGSPPPNLGVYQIGIIDALFNMSVEEIKKEGKRRLKLYKKAWKEYRIQRKKELRELKKLCKKDKIGKNYE